MGAGTMAAVDFETVVDEKETFVWLWGRVDLEDYNFCSW